AIDINNPQMSKLQIGDKYRTLSEYQAQANKQMMTVERLEERVKRLGSQNARINQQLTTAREELDTIQQSLLDVDLDNLPQELQTISQQILALQTTLDNLDIPEYSLATQTEDGLMSAVDKTKLDGIAQDDFIKQEERDKIGLISVTKPIDLDDLLARI